MSLRRLNASILSPLVAFPIAWALAALLSQLHLLDAQGPWSTVMIVVVIAVPLAFFAGGLIGQGIASVTTALSPTRSEPRISERTFRRVLIVLVSIGLLELAHQFALAGAIPLLSGNIDEARFSQGGPTILLTDLLTVSAILALVKPRELFSRESRFELGVAVVAVGSFALQGGRGSVVLPIIVAIVARWLFWGRPPTYVLVAGGMLALLAISLGFYLRVYQHPTTPFEAELFGEILPTMPFLVKPLVPVYVAITTNFLALQGVIGHFPTVAPFGHGVYDAAALDNFISGTRSIGDLSATLTPPWVTSTIAGPLWADGGFAVLIPGVAITGTLAAGAYAAAARTQSLRWSLVAAYLFFVALFGLYTNLWTQHIDWLVVAPLLLVLGAVAENPEAPPGVVGRLWGKIRAMRSTGQANSPPSPTSPGPERGPRLRSAFAYGSVGIVILFVAGLIVQRTLPEPYPKAKTLRLPTSVKTADAVMTNSDRAGENTQLWWVDRGGQKLAVHSADTNYSPVRLDTVRMRLPRSFDRVQYDIGAWPPLRDPALFVMHQERRSLTVLVKSTRTGRTVGRFRSPIPEPLPGARADFVVVSHGGLRPDLYMAVRQSPNSRVRIVSVSGESKFKRQLEDSYLPIRGAGPRQWSLDIGPIAQPAVENPSSLRPDLVLLERNPDLQDAMVRVMLGEDGFQGFAFQRPLDAPGDMPPSVYVLIGALRGATALYVVDPNGREGPTADIYPLQPPAGLY